MATSGNPALADERYLNLETFKKDGNGVKTPVWVAGLDGKIVVLTDGTSYKVKRVQKNPKARVAPCDVRGNVRGPWVDAECRIIDDPDRAQRAHRALKAKYGWQMWLLDVGATIGGRVKRRAFLEISV
jgi:uncharacterized protein